MQKWTWASSSTMTPTPETLPETLPGILTKSNPALLYPSCIAPRVAICLLEPTKRVVWGNVQGAHKPLSSHVFLSSSGQMISFVNGQALIFILPSYTRNHVSSGA